MKNQLSKTLGVVALVAQSLVFFACSSSTPSGAGGAGGGTSTGAGGSTVALCAQFVGSCACQAANPDSDPGGACADDCQSVGCGRSCTQDCCVSCGIDAMGIKACTCPVPGAPFANCTCSPPAGFPSGLTGGACSPLGYAAIAVPLTDTDPAAFSMKGLPCALANAEKVVCFTKESTTASERGCICRLDSPGVSTMHCGSVNHWFTNSGAAATTWQ
jgi:hypothetical protein